MHECKISHPQQVIRILGKKACVGGKKSNHYYKNFAKKTVPHPIFWNSTRASRSLGSCQMSDHSILMQSKKAKQQQK